MTEEGKAPLTEESAESKNFILNFIDEDIAEGGRFQGLTVHTRFPILIRIRFYRVNGKHLFPNGSAATHFKNIIGYRVLFLLQLGIVFGIDFLHNGLHTHSSAGIFV